MNFDAEFELVRGHIEPSLTFSGEALDTFLTELSQWVAGCAGHAWGVTNVPPTQMVVTVHVEVH